MSIDIDQTGIKSTFERAIKEGIDYVEILFHSEEPFMTSRKLKKFANGYGRKHSRPNISATQQPTVRSYMELSRTGLLMNKEKRERYKNGQHRSYPPLVICRIRDAKVGYLNRYALRILVEIYYKQRYIQT